jgi:hypothetical protein
MREHYSHDNYEVRTASSLISGGTRPCKKCVANVKIDRFPPSRMPLSVFVNGEVECNAAPPANTRVCKSSTTPSKTSSISIVHCRHGGLKWQPGQQWATGWSSVPGRDTTLFTPQRSDRLSGPNESASQLVPEALSAGIKRPGSEDDHSAPPKGQVKTGGQCLLNSMRLNDVLHN